MSYHGLIAALATQHGKEKAITPPLAAMTGLAVTVPQGIDTDALGTFTGETPRLASMRETLRTKAQLGMEATGLPIGIASEGSFGPHPFVPFLAGGVEMIVFIDHTRGIEVVEQAVSENTNFASLWITQCADVDGFLARIGFPEHAVVLRSSDHIIKGINSRGELDHLLRHCGEGARIETDMRAHLNPTRMTEIGKLAEKLASRIATPCPACSTPAFGTLRHEAGLRCEDCGAPTQLVRSIVKGCALCRHEEHLPRTDGRTFATAAECPECNP
ncbi:MAG: DUF6671 family protein [Aestuariivirga sp.]|uniref:DUF6671 family protein n=1 Tax=Aestuariivirga sp. TaxID=2650926 RepID=UPI003016E802